MDKKRSSMSSRHTALKHAAAAPAPQAAAAPAPQAAGIDDREAREMALFLMRVFGDEAAAVAADRAVKSDQAADWERVGVEIAKLMAADDLPDDGPVLRPFR